MAPLPVIEDVYRVALLWTDAGDGQHAVNVMHIWDVVGGHDADWVADRLQANVTSDMWALQSSNASIGEFQITPLDGASATQSYAPDTPANWDGGVGGDMIPAACTLVSLRTAQRGRSFRGRLYLPFVAESVQAAGLITSVLLADQRDAWTTFIGDMQGDNADVVVASYVLAQKGSVTSATVEAALATQRRRQSRVRAS